MTFEEQFAAFNSRADIGTDSLGNATPAEHQPAPLAAVPAVEEVVAEQAWVVPDSTPVEAPAAVVAAAYTMEDEQTDHMLADLERATESLSRFRQEIGRLVQ